VRLKGITELEADYSELLSNLISNLFNMHLEIEKNRKRAFRALWISRINAASRALGVSYSKLINGMTTNNIIIDRKILSDIAIHDPSTFEKIVQSANK